MSEQSDKIELKINSAEFGVFKTNLTGRRMKLYVKLNQHETEQWEALRAALTGNNVGDNELARVMFLRGVMAFTTELNERIDAMSDEEKDALLDEAGVTPEAVADDVVAVDAVDTEEDAKCDS